ncbi:MAG: ABC transporter substrate-binding protein [Alphaproteobacteria bacterium]|nr:ABC transporter substrate-binding protein [Alphaproteobacteria bacterium]
MLALAALAVFGLTNSAGAADAVKIANVIELSGGGATVGTNWRDAVELAAKQINEKGGILGRQIEVTHYDTQSNPGISKAQVTKALDGEPYVILGPIYSSSTKVNMVEAQRAGVPQIVGSEAAEITKKGNPTLFRTSFGQDASMPKIANYIRDGVKAKSVAVIWVNNAFGKGGRDTVVKELEARGIKVAVDISTEVQQVDFAAEVAQAKNSGADLLFPYLHEEESARLLRELKKQGFDKPIVGETTITNAKVIQLAGDAANGVRAHVGLSPDAPSPLIKKMVQDFEAAYGRKPDHNGLKGYIAVHMVKAVTEKMGKFDQQNFAKTLHGMTITTKDEPGVLMDVTFDDKGDPDRESFLVEVVDGKEKITTVLPPLGR